MTQNQSMSIYQAMKYLWSIDRKNYPDNGQLVVTITGKTKKERDEDFQKVSDDLRDRGYSGVIREA